MTQIIERSREVEEQKRHGSTSVRLVQTEQETILRFPSSSASTKRSTSVSVIRSTWKASRCAVFCPMPGRRLNSSMSLVTGSEYSSISSKFQVPSSKFQVKGGGSALNFELGTWNLELQQTWREHAAELRLHGLVNFSARLVDGGDDEGFEHFDVAFFDGLPV